MDQPRQSAKTIDMATILNAFTIFFSFSIFLFYHFSQDFDPLPRRIVADLDLRLFTQQVNGPEKRTPAA
jgi:hypothetical protein